MRQLITSMEDIVSGKARRYNGIFPPFCELPTRSVASSNRAAGQFQGKVKRGPIGRSTIDDAANMTYYGPMRSVTISFFKAHLSEELKKVRKGARMIVSDRDTPIAEVVPYNSDREAAISVREPGRVPFSLPTSTICIEHDPVEYLLSDRSGR